ncbi:MULTISPECIES: DUF411 domain-containing protein [unclassified Phenylobacterium]|jgi:hypothetical protein|uniref:DUF411 domain-containing protein n=1 Tax=unclassified Phenylobacterium TaxID=2640670 RepID=UPI000BCBE123|nr:MULTISPECIES: DUF411 domain-containing protein [unclassified Phenylobacterium]MCR5873119.1 DUF411 domain-containing protein [Phenylobacterium sp. J426]MCR5880160.1 DUF411 domain-containing protein [Phenylobacterium sp. J367]MDP1875558.1 DUF411 domain-containing protein [Phenylobacterium sp.]OYW91504.1 MAG: hypothetical protein B7Z13_12400 [Caulobacterales bacterium 32-67-6]
MILRRNLLAAAAAVLAAPHAWAAAPPPLTVYKTASCGCCRGWITIMTRAGYRPKVVNVEDITPIGKRHSVPFELSSCHLATIGGYVVVGHVPAADVGRLLKERPKALGITVPGMPLGSPGMEMPDGRKEPYQTLLLLPGGKTRVFARHG